MDPILFGHDNEQHIVAVHPNGESTMRLYIRNDTTVTYRDEEFFPFFHISDKRFIEGFSQKFWLKKLEGKNFYQYLCAFPSVPVLWDAVHHAVRMINKEFKTGFAAYQETDHIFLRPDMSTQYLLQSGKTLFKGMDFSDLYRMQIDIETYSKEYRFSRADRKDDRIILISMSDNRGWETVIGGKTISEKKLLQQCISIINEKDPDVLEGHNIFNFDLPYILSRCDLNEIEFTVGRDGSVPKGIRTRSSFSDSPIEYMSYEVAGRHIIDTWLLVQSYDSGKRTMESHGLKYAAKYFGVSSPDRTYIEGDKISWYWDNEADTLKKYSLDDVRETRRLSDKLSGSTFFLAQMLPFNYGTMTKLGAAAKIESIFLREYIKQRHAIPRPNKGVQTTGGYTDLFHTGIFSSIVHADVESLYPSIMLSQSIRPLTDDLGVFQTALKYLTVHRIETKRKLEQQPDDDQRTIVDAMQYSFKILINSFYGYLGYGKGLFNDYDQAEIITTTGQSLLKKLIYEIELHNGTVIEVDTDGIYFIPPDNVVGEEAERKFVNHLSKTLPEGINLAYSGRYKKMCSYKKKNYALLHHDERITIKGSSLISRSMERFAKNYVQQCIELLINTRLFDLHTLFVEMDRTIREHAWDVNDFAKTETLRDPLEEYLSDVKADKRNRSAAYELALQSSRKYKTGSKIRYYITGSDANVKAFQNAKEAHEWDANFPDENTQYYVKRLEELSAKFDVFFSEQDFRSIFSTDDLFGFDPSAVSIVNRKIATTDSARQERSEEYTIELDNDDV
jgi:DNA polymerase elongation subunit (family B)